MINAPQSNNASALFSGINASSSSLANKTTNPLADSQTTFLKLLVTQMQNQDPMNPMDNAQMTSQMAQLNTVNGINQLNATLQAMSNSVTTGQTLQAAALIGHGVLTPGSNLDLSNGLATGGVNLAGSASKMQININDANGNTVRTLSYGAMPAGMQVWQWDGKDDAGNAMPNGAYSYSVSALQGNTSVDVSSLEYNVVNGVTPSPKGVSLNVGLNGMVDFAQVQQIF